MFIVPCRRGVISIGRHTWATDNVSIARHRRRVLVGDTKGPREGVTRCAGIASGTCKSRGRADR